MQGSATHAAGATARSSGARAASAEGTAGGAATAKGAQMPEAGAGRRALASRMRTPRRVLPDYLSQAATRYPAFTRPGLCQRLAGDPGESDVLARLAACALDPRWSPQDLSEAERGRWRAALADVDGHYLASAFRGWLLPAHAHGDRTAAVSQAAQVIVEAERVPPQTAAHRVLLADLVAAGCQQTVTDLAARLEAFFAVEAALPAATRIPRRERDTISRALRLVARHLPPEHRAAVRRLRSLAHTYAPAAQIAPHEPCELHHWAVLRTLASGM